MTTLMLVTKTAIYPMVNAGLAEHTKGTYEVKPEVADRLAEASCKNAGFSRVIRVYHDHGAGGLFCDVE